MQDNKPTLDLLVAIDEINECLGRKMPWVQIHFQCNPDVTIEIADEVARTVNSLAEMLWEKGVRCMVSTQGEADK